MGLYDSYLFYRKFDMNNDHSKYTIWKIYHDENQIKNYKLCENERIYLFNTTNNGYEGKHINQLNRFICEGTGILYPYLNNLKSDIIGFQHYRRWFHSKLTNIKYNEITDGKIQIFTNGFRMRTNYDAIYPVKYKDCASHFAFWKIINNGFYQDFINFLTTEFPEFLESLKERNMFHQYSIFICNWDNYIKLCDILWGYINFIANRYHFDLYNDLDWSSFIEEHFILYNRNNDIVPRKCKWSDILYGHDNWFTLPYDHPNHFQYGLYRILSFNIEYIVSAFANYIGYIFDENNKLVLI